MDRAPASLSSLPRRPGLRTSARHPGRRGPLHAIPRSVVDRVTSLERGIGQQRPGDDELVIKLSEVGAAAHLQSLERPRQAQFPVPTAVFRTSGDGTAARPPPAGGSAVGRGLPRCVTIACIATGRCREGTDQAACARRRTARPCRRRISVRRAARRSSSTDCLVATQGPAEKKSSSGDACGKARSSRKVRSCSRITPPIGNSPPVLYPQFAHSKTSELRPAPDPVAGPEPPPTAAVPRCSRAEREGFEPSTSLTSRNGVRDTSVGACSGTRDRCAGSRRMTRCQAAVQPDVQLRSGLGSGKK